MAAYVLVVVSVVWNLLVVSFLSSSSSSSSSLIRTHPRIGINVSKDHEVPSFCSKTQWSNLSFQDHTPFSYLITEESLCGQGPVSILNYVQSGSDHFQRRMMIRETFGSLKYVVGGVGDESVKLMFLVGIPQNQKIQELIEKESATFRDVVQADFKDTYRNLTLKHLVALHWIHTFCPRARFVTKSDDDCFVNNSLLLTLLRDLGRGRTFRDSWGDDKAFFLGVVSYGPPPIRIQGSKWTVDWATYPLDRYPNYIRGYGYLMSRAAIRPLLVCSYFQKYFFIDDVFISGIVAESAKIPLVNFPTHYHSRVMDWSFKTQILDTIFLFGDNTFDEQLWRLIWRQVWTLVI